jgi:hypothetical protein
MPKFNTITFEMPPAKIALFKAIVESYDNLATLRTENPDFHRLRLYCAAECLDEVVALLNELTTAFSITQIVIA